MYPIDDEDFEETTIVGVKKSDDGWSIERQDGFSFFINANDTFAPPKEGMTARFYGKGIGYPVRGLFLNGDKVFYQNAKEHEASREIEMFGADAADWLKRWDDGKTVWSIEMGGLGPAYEQCIHITAAEILRFILDKNYQHSDWNDKEKWKRDRDEIEQHSFSNERIKSLGGITGAQYGSALNLATNLFIHGPIHLMKDERVKDRHIQVSKNFPSGN